MDDSGSQSHKTDKPLKQSYVKRLSNTVGSYFTIDRCQRYGVGSAGIIPPMHVCVGGVGGVQSASTKPS